MDSILKMFSSQNQNLPSNPSLNSETRISFWKLFDLSRIFALKVWIILSEKMSWICLMRQELLMPNIEYWLAKGNNNSARQEKRNSSPAKPSQKNVQIVCIVEGCCREGIDFDIVGVGWIGGVCIAWNIYGVPQ